MLDNEPTEIIGLVLVPSFAEKLSILTQEFHAWAIQSEENSAQAFTIRASQCNNFGVTTFWLFPEESLDNAVSRILNAIEEHHGVYSATDPYKAVHIYSEEALEFDQSLLHELCFAAPKRTSFGYILSKL